jgi:hypothetical protein
MMGKGGRDWGEEWENELPGKVAASLGITEAELAETNWDIEYVLAPWGSHVADRIVFSAPFKPSIMRKAGVAWISREVPVIY